MMLWKSKLMHYGMSWQCKNELTTNTPEFVNLGFPSVITKFCGTFFGHLFCSKTVFTRNTLTYTLVLHAVILGAG